MSTFVLDTEKMERELDFNALGAKVLEEIQNGKPMLGKDGTFAPMLEKILNAALEGEMDAHLSEESRAGGNRCNGKMDKRVKKPVGEVMSLASSRSLVMTGNPSLVALSMKLCFANQASATT